MKTYNFLKNIAGGIIVCGTLCTTSCTSFDELNTDPTRMDEVTKRLSTTGNSTTTTPTT